MSADPDDILAAWLHERDRGGERSPEEVIREHPELAGELRARFDAIQVFASSACPTSIGRHRILRELGRGSMGIVYEAEQTDLQRRVALKVLSPVIANDAEAVARFYREAQAAARLEHRNIAAVHEFGRDQAFIFYSMELVEGESLHRWLEARRAGETEPGTYGWLARLFADVATALQVAHDAGVVHRDVKPSNILIAPDGTPKVVDFGLARIGGTSETLTSPGAVVGTLHYMSPEQATAGEVDARADVYSLGASLYETLTLRPPFGGDDPVRIISSIVSDEPVPPRRIRPGVPRDLETIALKAMAKEPRRRYATARELAEDLERFLRDEPIHARRPGLLLRARSWARRRPARSVAAAAALVTGALVVLLWPDTEALPEIAEGMPLGEFTTATVPGVPGEAPINGWAGFLLPGRGMGTAVATLARERQGKRPDLCAFGPERDLLWSARSEWPDYESTLGWGDATLRITHCLVTRGGEPSPEETLVLSAYHHGRMWLILVDPQTGARRGKWPLPDDFRSGYDEKHLGVLPDWSDEPRRLMVPGRSSGLPALFIIETDGTPVRRYEFPTVGTKPGVSVGHQELKCDWSRDEPEVVIVTDEGVFFALLVEDRLLDLASARVSLADDVDDHYDAIHGEGAFEKLVEEKGGHSAFLRGLAGGITVEGG